MTLPASGPISLAQVAAELGISTTGISLNHSWVRDLAGLPGGSITLANLFGKTGSISGNLATNSANNVNEVPVNYPYFDSILQYMSTDFTNNYTNVVLDRATAYAPSAILVTNRSSGASLRLPYVGGGQFSVSGARGDLLRTGAGADSFLIQPSN